MRTGCDCSREPWPVKPELEKITAPTRLLCGPGDRFFVTAYDTGGFLNATARLILSVWMLHHDHEAATA
jgi:hypothetical protein